MNFYAKVYLLKKDKSNMMESFSLFFKNSGLDYAGQFANPDVFYSAVVGSRENIIIFDPESFCDDVVRVSEMLASLQEFTDSKIILTSNLNNMVFPFKFTSSNENIKDFKVRISDSLLRVIKEYNNDPNNSKSKLYIKLRGLLSDLGFNNSDLGFNYICDCVYYILRENKPNIKLVGEVYKHVARMNGALDYRIERDIRHAINTAMNNCNHKKLLSNEKLKCFDAMMFGTTAKNLIYAIVGFIKYDTIFVA